ncbi:acetyltransferase (GNAT) family protein [Nitrospirillum amazonense]|uniref:Acetyltransferase (GNAT) family protein n=1 Tax=Nitrospirillum amazonense TaxID=28077 RepID=A0A560EUD5_9PROT|nr:GNAT family N-acetyltransferase [Nitrospirillum amazonense]TWB12957.1 acetyltransferase (GNAT) family protein [Nitrospirillum amazonense]
MNGFKLLIDTNIVIRLEDAQPVQASLAELVRLCTENSVGLFVDGANYDDIARDKDAARRAVTLSKLAKFPQLRDIPLPPEADLIARFGEIKRDNDRSDVRLLAVLDAKAVDFLVTEDIGLHRRADRAGIGASVLTVEEALEWLRQTFQAKAVRLPYVEERKAYEIDPKEPILGSLRRDYPEFDGWFDSCRKKHRDCWVLEIDDQIAGIVIRKDEAHAEAGTVNPGPKILKVCTFKIRDEFRGEKFGELLLKQVLWFSQQNGYDLVYLTVFPKHGFLIDLLRSYGFEATAERGNGEWVMEKVMIKGPLPAPKASICEEDRLVYPRFYDGEVVRKFCIPIRPDYHRRLFPEIAEGKTLPLFPSEVRMLDHRRDRTPGNTIRKVYLCRAKITKLRPGDLLLFYMSKDEAYNFSQSITTVGIIEQVNHAAATDDLIRLTAKRSVFSEKELDGLAASPKSPIKVIDFLLAGHISPPPTLDNLLRSGVFNGSPPQSIAELNAARYAALRPNIKLGFDL